MYSALIAFGPKKSKDLRAIEKTLILLSGYHAEPFDNERFQKRYKSLIIMYRNLCKKEGIIKCLI